MGRRMGMDYGLEKEGTCIKRKFRWLLKIPGISASGISSLPPEKSARPNINFKELSAEHLNETIYMPGKPEWKSINLTLYELKKNEHPVFGWIQKAYDPCDGKYKPFLDERFKMNAILELYNGCGDIIEKWTYENAWPQAVNWGELNMSESNYLTCQLTLRYDRAKMIEPNMC